MKTILWRGLQTVLWIVLLGFVLLIALARFTPYEVLIVRSGSMEPTISTGGVVVVDRAARSPKVGAIVSFRDLGGEVITHRVVRIARGEYITRGDANRADDVETRPATAVYGAFVLSLPLLGYLIYVLQQPVVFLVLLLGTGGFLIADALRTIGQELTRMRRERRVPDAD